MQSRERLVLVCERNSLDVIMCLHLCNTYLQLQNDQKTIQEEREYMRKEIAMKEESYKRRAVELIAQIQIQNELREAEQKDKANTLEVNLSPPPLPSPRHPLSLSPTTQAVSICM
jgi:seryl-tRNA synthetase